MAILKGGYNKCFSLVLSKLDDSSSVLMGWKLCGKKRESK
jgi:hypothetical protein